MKTVDQVVREMGFEPTPQLNWAAGTIIANRWRQIYGCEPHRELREKTNASPSVGAPHMKCVYPPEFEGVMREVILELDPSTSPQEGFEF